jgi:hypothetical protein
VDRKIRSVERSYEKTLNARKNLQAEKRNTLQAQIVRSGYDP